ncbi:hypothetical protein V8C34DRAFT_295674 [Trichoderma compactum]
MDEHIRIYAQCGACSYAFTAGDLVVTLIKELDNTITAASPAIKFRNSLHCYRDNERSYCRSGNCIHCLSSVSTVTVHEKCLELLEQLCTAKLSQLCTAKDRPFQLCTVEDKLSWLWIGATWKSPWNGSPPLQQILSPNVNISHFTRWAAEACKMPSLRSLPVELAFMIYRQLNHDDLYRSLSFLDFARWSHLGYHKRVKTIPVIEIEEWQRGAHPIMNEMAAPNKAESDKRIILLSIDSKGLQCIKRLRMDETDSYSPQSYPAVYVVEEAECFSSVQVEYNYPFARLHLAGGREHFRIWDTPSPPQWQECVIDKNYDYTRAKGPLNTIDTRATSGITFFIASGFVWALHTHTKKQPSAQLTFNTLNSIRQSVVQWVYVPLGNQDTIATFGWSYNSAKSRFFLRLKLAGEIVVGSTYEMKDENVQLVKDPLTLIYERPDSEAITFVGGHACGAASSAASAEQEAADALPAFTFRQQPFSAANYSSAPLNDVIRTQLFHERGSPTCRGIILEYRNGAKRALGQCRLGIDRTEECTEPVRFCYSNSLIGGRQSVQVHIAKDSSHTHEGGGWICCMMRGDLEFWFTNKEGKINWQQ